MLAFSLVATATLWMPQRRFQTTLACATDLAPFGATLDLIARSGRSAHCVVVGRSHALLVSPDVRARFGSGSSPLRVRVYVERPLPDCCTRTTPATCSATVVPCIATLAPRRQPCG